MNIFVLNVFKGCNELICNIDRNSNSMDHLLMLLTFPFMSLIKKQK